MPINLVASALGPNPSSITTAYTNAFDSTGANLIVVVVGSADPSFSMTDNYGNTYSTRAQRQYGDSTITIRACLNPVVGPNHVVTVNQLGSNLYPTLIAAAYSGVGSMDAANTGQVFAQTSINTGSVTAPIKNSLVIAGTTAGSTLTGETVSAPFSILGNQAKVGFGRAVVMADCLKDPAGSISATFSGINRSGTAAIAVFKPPVNESELASSDHGHVRGGTSANTVQYHGIFVKGDNQVSFARKGWVLFDVPTESLITKLTINVSSNPDNSSSVGLRLYGVNNEATANHDTTTWNNLPGNDTSSSIAANSSTATLLATVANLGNNWNAPVEFSIPNSWAANRSGNRLFILTTNETQSGSSGFNCSLGVVTYETVDAGSSALLPTAQLLAATRRFGGSL